MKWSFLIKFLIKRFPQWAVAAFISLGSFAIFVGWLIIRGGGDDRNTVPHERVPVHGFAASDVILCGNTLVEKSTGKIIAQEWLRGFGAITPPIACVIPDDNLVLVTSGTGAVAAFGFEGIQRPVLHAEGKPVSVAAFDRGFSHIVYPTDGNLWRGDVDWKAGKISAAKKFTDVGYFQADLFQRPWLWHEDELLVSAMGKTLEVDFEGSVTELPIRLDALQRGLSLDGSFAVINSGMTEIGVADLITGKSKVFPVGQRVRKLLWLTSRKVVFIAGSDSLVQYDHDKGEIELLGEVSGGIRDLLEPAPDSSCFLVVSVDSLQIFDVGTKSLKELRFPFDEVNWIDSQSLLCSSNAVGTEPRGLWLVKRTGEMSKLSNLPMDIVRAPLAPQYVRDSGFAYFVCGGNLWSFELANTSLKQITQQEKLSPQLQLLNH